MENPSDNKFAWHIWVEEALVEIDLEKLKERVVKAETVLFQRFQALEENSDGLAERRALEDASRSLLVLKKELLKFPDWKPD